MTQEDKELLIAIFFCLIYATVVTLLFEYFYGPEII